MKPTTRFLRAGTAALALAGGWAIPQTATRNQEFYEFDQINAKLIGNGKVRILVTGKPMRARFATQKMRIAAQRFEGVVQRTAGAPTQLETGSLRGSVRWEIDRPSAIRGSTELQTLTLETETAQFAGATQTVSLPGALQFRRSDPGADETMQAKAASGELILLGPAAGPSRTGLKEFSFAGPVEFSMRGRVVENGKPAVTAAGKPLFGTLQGRADRMTYDDSAGKLKLIGRVRIDGDHPILFGSIDASLVVITLDAAGRIDEIDVIGDPSTTEIGRRPPPRGSGIR